MSFEPDAVTIEPKTLHQASVIWLHGLGADGHNFEPIVPELNLDPESGIRFIFPHAPKRPVTINNGMNMRAWYDIKAPNLRALEDSESIIESSKLITRYINAEIETGIESNKVILAGFSQGGAITLHVGLRYAKPLAGLLALSTYLPLADRLEEEVVVHKSMPIMMAHGISDPVIPVEHGRASAEALKNHGYRVEWQEYMMQHAVCIEEIIAIGAWIKRVLA
jgi:phospholipase/carboxylesterase